MEKLLLSVILSVCPGYDKDQKGQVITTECQEWFVNCAVQSDGSITQKSITTCQEKYKHGNNKPR